jgi:glutaminase
MKRSLKLLLPLVLSLVLSAENLSLSVGNSVAGQDYTLKGSQFVLRLNGCADLSTAQVVANAEGTVAGVRRSVKLRVTQAQISGVYAVAPQWGSEGTWVVAVTATCGAGVAGAIVPIVARSFSRENLQLLSHAPAAPEIESALKAVQ